jgi:hypothetical protein
MLSATAVAGHVDCLQDNRGQMSPGGTDFRSERNQTTDAVVANAIEWRVGYLADC